MKQSSLTFLIIIILISCNSKISKSKDIESGFEKSFKDYKNRKDLFHIDSTSNIYSNFKYNVGFDGPNRWNFDLGLNKRTIYRTFQQDSSITFSINVTEIKEKTMDREKIKDIWELYNENRERMDNPLKKILEEQLNTKVQDFKASKSYLKNNVALRRSLNYDVKSLDYEYNLTSLSYQVLINNLMYSFSLSIPSIYYKEKPYYYEELFNNIYFLKNGERLNQIIHNKEK